MWFTFLLLTRLLSLRSYFLFVIDASSLRFFSGHHSLLLFLPVSVIFPLSRWSFLQDSSLLICRLYVISLFSSSLMQFFSFNSSSASWRIFLKHIRSSEWMECRLGAPCLVTSSRNPTSLSSISLLASSKDSNSIPVSSNFTSASMILSCINNKRLDCKIVTTDF